MEIPTISAEPEHQGDVQRGADLAASFLRDMGGTAEVHPTPRHPVVLGSLGDHPGAPTVTVYNHIDVQPADPTEWHHPPFQFVVEGDRYSGRGTTDDKGPALTALFAARYCYRQDLPLNFRFLWELEEEIGSPHFDGFLQAHAFPTDSVLVSDTVWIARDQPALPFGLRGCLQVRLLLQTGQKSTHSGTTGGVARNPIGELCQVIDALYDARTGEVHVPGFYDEVAPPTPEELAGYDGCGFDLERFQQVYQFRSVRAGDARDAVRRLMARPTFELHGMVGGYTGPGVKTIVPHQAEAKLSMRLVPDMSAARTLERLQSFIHRVNPDVEVVHEATLPVWSGDRHSAFYQAAADALEAGFGRRPVLVREGCSIGAVLSMAERLRAPVVLMGLSLPEHGYHEPNENYDWGQASGGIRAFVDYFQRLAAMQKVSDGANPNQGKCLLAD
ncbi:MAG TPA: M20/M25/M40 family metallo-hydrolase [Candidatus Xenobia bacterium]